MDDRQLELQEKLEELKKYEENERNQMLLQSKKSVLTKEQLQMYNILGISLSSFSQINYDPGDSVDDEREFEVNEKIQEIEHSADSDEELNTSNRSKEYNNELVNNTLEKGSSIYVKDGSADAQQVVKKPFLKRGAGLSSRFRIPPDAYNLKNLPRYKYQDRLQKTIRKQKGTFVQETGGSRKSNENPKRTSSEGTKKLNKIEDKENVKPLKSSSDTNIIKVQANEANFKSRSSIEVMESIELSVPKNINLKAPPEIKMNEVNLEKFLPQNQIEETPKVTKTAKTTSWAQILSSNNINDCSIKLDQFLNEPFDNDDTDLMQLLEEKMKNFEASPEVLMKILQSLGSKEDDTIVDEPLIENPENVKIHLEPSPKDLAKKITIDDSEDSEDDGDDVTGSDHRVRFSDNVEVMQQNTLQDDEANSTILSSDLEAVDLVQTSTPNEREKFEEFKLKMLGRQKQHDDIVEKADQLKMKLQEIEQEKLNVLKMRSNLELEKLQLEQERDDMAEKMKDERVKMEIELHDERIKLDQQKQKYEKLIRDAKNQTSKKEREEITKLKECIEELKEEMKNKEARHASTTARYRSQIKQLEKDNQTFKLELEVARKDNKRLELENARLKRDTNSKMLQEINKNIAKLTKPEIIEKPKTTEKPKVSVKKPTPPSRNRPQTSSAKTTEVSSSSESEDEDPKSKTLNPLKTRLSDPATSKASKSSTDILSEMKREIVNADGSRDIWYPNGNLKKISPDGMLIRMLYYNKDIKETNMNEGTIKYYYADNNTWHTTYIDGLEILEYPNGQIEHRYKDGTIEIHYSDGSIRLTNKNWTNDVKEEWRMPDGTNAKIFNNNTKILSFPNGQREVHTANHKRREFPDGTVKIMYADGSMETRYSNGRVRVKDKDGNLVSDNMQS